MRAAVMRAVDEPLSIEDVELADPQPFEVVVRVAAAGLCHSDVRFMEGAYATDLPTVVGHESAGVVERVGASVTYVSPGDHVVTSLSVFCGTCRFCLDGRAHLCENRNTTRRREGAPPRLSQAGEPVHQLLDMGSFAELMLVHEHAVVKVPPDIPLDRAALLGCGVVTGLGAVLNTAGVGPGDTVAVIGCGGVGLSAVQGARIACASMVIAVDRVPEKLLLAQRLGATHTVDASVTDPVEEVRALTGGGVGHAIEAIGAVVTSEQAFAMLERGGTATIVGLVPEGLDIRIPGAELTWEKRIQGSNMGSNRFRIDTPKYVAMYRDGRLDLDALVSSRIRLDDVNAGFDEMRTGRIARNVIVFDTGTADGATT